MLEILHSLGMKQIYVLKGSGIICILSIQKDEIQTRVRMFVFARYFPNLWLFKVQL